MRRSTSAENEKQGHNYYKRFSFFALCLSYFRPTALSHNSGIALPAENKRISSSANKEKINSPFLLPPRRRIFYAPPLPAENKRKPNISPLKNKHRPKIKKKCRILPFPLSAHRNAPLLSRRSISAEHVR